MARFRPYTIKDSIGGSTTNILKMHADGMGLQDAIVAQAGKYPKPLRQWWANRLMLEVLVRMAKPSFRLSRYRDRSQWRRYKPRKRRKNAWKTLTEPQR